MDWSADRPTFWLLNTGETHYPYATPEEPEERWPRINGVNGVFKTVASGQPLHRDQAPRFFNDDKLDLLRRRQIRAVTQVDRVLEQLYDTVPDNTWITITSDHGELFGEGGYFGHGPILHDKVPEALGEGCSVARPCSEGCTGAAGWPICRPIMMPSTTSSSKHPAHSHHHERRGAGESSTCWRGRWARARAAPTSGPSRWLPLTRRPLGASPAPTPSGSRIGTAPSIRLQGIQQGVDVLKAVFGVLREAPADDVPAAGECCRGLASANRAPSMTCEVRIAVELGPSKGYRLMRAL